MIFAIFAMCTQLVFAQPRNAQRQARAFTEQGDKAFRQKNYREAADAYNQAIILVPTNPYGHYWKANALYSLKEYEEADRAFVLALNQGFKPIEIYRIRWYMYYDQKNYDAALSDIQKGLQIEPRNILFLRGLGEVQLLRNVLPESLEAYQKALLLAPRDGDIYYSIARVHSAMGNYKAQAASADEAIKRGTQYMGDTFYILADAYERDKNYPGAIDAYNKTISAKPDNKQAYRNLATLFQRQNRYTEAIDTLKKAIYVFPTDGDFYTDISWYYSLADRPAEAVSAAISATKLLPNAAMGFTNLCRALNETKQYQQAITACNTALRVNPKDGETNFYLGRASDLLGRTAEATRFYKLAVAGLVDFTKANPNHADGYYLLGNAYFSDNQRDRAVEAFRRTLEITPSFAKARYNLGRILVLLKNRTGAMEQYTLLLSLNGTLATTLKAEIDKL